MAADATLDGHAALITGARRGIGYAIARRLAAHGATVLLHASPASAAALVENVAALRATGARAFSLTADLGDSAARADLLERATAVAGGPIDILLNNAATIGAYAPPGRIDLAARQQLFAVNVDAPLDLIQQALPAMRAAGWGRIVNLSSDTTVTPPLPYPGPAKFVHALTAYGASKAALERYSSGLAAELHGSGITVNALKPYRIVDSESAAAVVAQMAATHPDWIEPVALMAEAAYQLIVRGLNGEITVSRALLARLQAPVHALDGETRIGDAQVLATSPAARGG
jgi:NAD(P)-dependent dehydrogenase (short-subunit alcohol dehydrogenase family)